MKSVAGRPRHRISRLLRVAMMIAAGIAVSVAVYVMWPLPDGLTSTNVSGIRIEDRHGLVLRTTRVEDGNLQRWSSLDALDPDVIAAFVAVEDHRFFEHHGVDLRAVARAARDNLRGGGVLAGASTITMQLARIYHGTPRSWLGKIAQVLQSWRLEWHLDKSTILEQYLNRVPLGQGAVGVAAAANLYFNKSPNDLSLGEAALLAGLARAPSSNNPLVSSARAERRRRVGLLRLEATGYVTPVEAARAGLEPIMSRRRTQPFLAPHFTSRILSSGEDSSAQNLWRTSLDLVLQQLVEAEARHTVDRLATVGARHAAAVVLDNKTGEVLAWVGSPDFWADTAGQVDMVVSPRQPGSALKPFLYGLAFDRGFTAASILPDIAQTYATSVGPYRPRNYDRRFHGPVRAREALASSYNIPAVELTERLGAPALLRTLREAGFTSLNHSPGFYGLGLALGNGDVTLVELANGYRALANGGVWTPYTWRTHDGVSGSAQSRRVLTQASAALVLDILQDPIARIPGFGLTTPFDFPFPVAAKTGTSRHFTDNWAVGATGNFTVAVWVGDFSGRPMDRVSGITGAGPLLHRIIMLTSQRYDPGTLPEPQESGAVRVTICALSGERAGPDCPHQEEWFSRGSEPSGVCRWHRSGSVMLPALYQEWAEQTGISRREYSVAQSGADDSTSSVFHITSPVAGDRYTVPPGVDRRYATVALRSAGGKDPDRVRWTVNGTPVHGGRWPLEPGRFTVTATAKTGEMDSVHIEVTGLNR
jgi:penicillin-binding protein 1C